MCALRHLILEVQLYNSESGPLTGTVVFELCGWDFVESAEVKVKAPSLAATSVDPLCGAYSMFSR